MKRSYLLFGLALGYLGAAVACGARSELDAIGSSGPGSGGSGASNVGGSGGVAGMGGSGGDGGIGGGPPECVVFNSSAALAPLDLFIMMDASGSMEFQTGGGPKWVAMRNAFDAFFSDPESAGMGVAISFFPIIDTNVPQVCVNDGTCGGGPGMCEQVETCLPNGGGSCNDDNDCTFPGDTCKELGYCQNAPDPLNTFCQDSVGLPCANNFGPCVPYAYCENYFTCDAGPYESPVAGVVALPGGSSAILQAINAHDYDGGTPTLPALTGALDHAIDWSNSNADHKVIALLATDGLPTICDPALDLPDPSPAIDNLADVAANGLTNGIQTFVVGVFTPDEQMNAKTNLDKIALAGGSGSSFVVSTNGSVTDALIQALNEVRVTATSCEFAFTLDSMGEPVDYTDIYVRIVDSDSQQSVWVQLVDDEDSCHSTNGGFYYDVPANGPVAPSRITLCPATCDHLGAAVTRTIEVYTTCEDDPGG